ncbi:hypothetical protein RKD47_004948 [Streptomyces albogriseolus]
MITHHPETGRGSGPRRSRNRLQWPPGRHSLELTGKELRS